MINRSGDPREVTNATVAADYPLPGAMKNWPDARKNLCPGTSEIMSAQDDAFQMGSGTHFVYLSKIPEAFQR